MKDYYLILGIDKSANFKEIRAAYRSLSLKFHPDINLSKDATDKFIEISEAYSVLRNAMKKSRYDRLSNTLSKRTENRGRGVDRAAQKGQRKGAKYAERTVKHFEKKEFRWGFDILWDLIIEAIFSFF